ncbi:hypothetical protein H8S90_22955 [Olivibacter sp. SDN3]|uniref:hypothetical protein n=1 Tax=Olivibacter sp. SDN3 TaxID=2764720 RepID=UPI001650E9AC|nr:hypothetical protein [Olivibacter sp. SDN3]QNL49551.1 hypothetical protein H8S90_22955 [Olivibacter sp. SDN3]
MKGMFNSRWKFVLIPVLVVAILALVGYVVMWLWNHTITEIFTVQKISFWQALGLFILCKILFGFGGRKGGGGWKRAAMRRKFAKLSDEEKERFKASFKSSVCQWERDWYEDGPNRSREDENDGQVNKE